MSCCGPFQQVASRHFDEKKVAEEVKRYRDHGLGMTARMLADGIARSGPINGTVLDVGAGIAGLTLTLLERGATSAVAVDASAAYIAAAKQEAEHRGRDVQFVHADFVTVAATLDRATVVTLDRVVCCYLSWAPLIEAALGRADRCIALSYPRDVWYVHAAMGLENGHRWLKRNPFRAFVHPAAAIQRLITEAGFALSSRAETWMWAADVYVR